MTRRISPNTTITLEQLDKASLTTSEAALPLPASLAAPFQCSTNLFTMRETWEAHCAKRAHSFLGCSCAPVKPARPAPLVKPAVIDQRINFGGDL